MTSTETTYRTIDGTTYADVRAGDRVTFEHENATGPIIADACPSRTASITGITTLHAAMIPLDSHLVIITKIERPVPELPTRPGAVVAPLHPGGGSMYVTDPWGVWQVVGLLEDAVTPAEVRQALMDGTHVVVSTGMEASA